MSYGLWKAHHAIMKSTAMNDYNRVKNHLIESGEEGKVIEPKGKHWHKIEDATKAMLLTIPNAEVIFEKGLNRGYSYYLSI
jgi:hypothetical protein